MDKKVELLLNPYRQLEAWYLYHLYSLEYGEQCLAALQAVEDKMMQYDAINKKRHRPTLQDKAPYNYWLNIPVEQFIHPYLTALKEKILYKRAHPSEAVSFVSGISDTFMRFKEERQHFFDAAQPEGIDADATGEINDLIKQAYVLDNRTRIRSFGGYSLNSILRDLNDQKVRDYYDVFVIADKNNEQTQRVLKEPKVFPNFLVHSSDMYITKDKIPRTGIWMPEFDYMYLGYEDNLNDIFGIFGQARHAEENLIFGPKEYGLIPIFNNETGVRATKGETQSDTRWVYIEVIPPGTDGIPDNPLRLEHLRIPYKDINKTLSIFGGNPAPEAGTWFCPNMGSDTPAAKQYFQRGEILPEGSSTRGTYVWHLNTTEIQRIETYSQVVDRYKQFYENFIKEGERYK